MKYTINHHTEETDCKYCGFPLYIGDTALDKGGDVFCSWDCYNRLNAITPTDNPYPSQKPGIISYNPAHVEDKNGNPAQYIYGPDGDLLKLVKSGYFAEYKELK